MFMLKDYVSTGKPHANARWPRASVFHGIPMDKLEVTKILLAHLFPSGKFRIRYRGSRKNDWSRTPTQRRQDCSKRCATSFSVYYR